MRLLTPLHGLATVGIAGAVTALVCGPAFAEALETIGVPLTAGTGFQPASSPTAVEAQGLDSMLLIIISVITAVVCLMMLYVIVRYRAGRNPVPAKFTHNAPLEVAWTLIPIVVLVFIGSFSVPALFFQQEIPVADLTIKVTGNQWYWTYEYPDAGVRFDSNMIGNDATIDSKTEPDVVPFTMNDAMATKLENAGYKKEDFLLAVDNPLIIPVGKTIVVDLTGSDVIHAWAMPAFAVMHSAVPGRLGQLWFKADKEGIYFGQCTALCGMNHAYMPIEVKVVSQATYDAWIAQAKTGNVTLASN